MTIKPTQQVMDDYKKVQEEIGKHSIHQLETIIQLEHFSKDIGRFNVGDIVNRYHESFFDSNTTKKYDQDKFYNKRIFIVDYVFNNGAICGRVALISGFGKMEIINNLGYAVEIDSRAIDSVMLGTIFDPIEEVKKQKKHRIFVSEYNKKNAIYIPNKQQLIKYVEDKGGEVDVFLYQDKYFIHFLKCKYKIVGKDLYTTFLSEEVAHWPTVKIGYEKNDVFLSETIPRSIYAY